MFKIRTYDNTYVVIAEWYGHEVVVFGPDSIEACCVWSRDNR